MKFVILFIHFLLFYCSVFTKSLRKYQPHHLIPHFSKSHSKSLQKISKILLSKLKSPSSFYRFSEIHTQTSQKNEFFHEIPFVSAQANSTYLQQNIIHPASSAINDNFGYWCSSGSHYPQDWVFWQGDFLKVESITHLMIKWAYAPSSYAIFVSSNGQDFIESVPWKECASGEANKLWRDSFWWWKWKDTSFLEMVTFGETVMAKSIKIVMKKPAAFFFGIYSIKALEKKTNVLIKTHFENEYEESCLTKRGDRVFARDCVNALSFSKGEEIFRLKKDYKIQKSSFETEKKCLTFSEKKETLNFSPCNINASNIYNNWEFSPKDGFLGLRNLSQKCLQANKGYFSLIRADVQVTATSKMNDDQHNPENPFLRSPGISWASSPGDQETHYIVRFDELPLRQISIKWKFIPKIFLIQVFLNEIYWKTVLNVTNNNKVEEILDLEMDFVSGIKVIFKETDSRFNDLRVYGIEEFNIITQLRNVGIFNCEKNGHNQEGTTWKMEEYNEKFNDAQNQFSKYRMEMQSLFKHADKISYLNQEIKKNNEPLQNFMENGKKIKKKLQNILESYASLHDRINKFKENHLKSQEFEILKKRSISSLGSTQFRPGEDCAAIKRALPRKRSGFFWIQPFCAQFPIRIFCDFNDNSAKDYYFIEVNQKSSLKSLKDIESMCANYGLAPIDIISTTDLKRLKQTFKGVTNEIGTFIPIAVDPGCEKNKCTGKFVSLSSKKLFDPSLLLTSSNSIDFFPSFSKQYDFMSLNLIPFPIITSKVKGVICSTNNRRKEDEESWIKLKCTDSVRDNKDFFYGNPQNARFKVKCPRNCLNQKKMASIWGTEFYKDDSAVCLAAIYNNKIENENGGYITVGIFEGKAKRFEGGLFNGVQSLDWEDDWDRSFNIEKYDFQCPGDMAKYNFNKRKLDFMRFFEKDNIIDEEKSSNPMECKSKLEEIFKRKRQELNYLKEIANNSTIVFGEFQKQLKLAEKEEIYPDVQEHFLIKNSDFFQRVNKLLADVQKLANSKLKEKIQRKNELLKEKMKFSIDQNFIEDYSKQFEENWEISRELHHSTDSHNWSYTFSSSTPSLKAIQCIQLDEKVIISSFLLLKNMKLYDGIISFAFKSIEKGLVGLAFRYKDAFNYYILEISRSKETSECFKRLRKVKDGISSELNRIEDGGFIENIWHKVEIKFKMDQIQVSIEEINSQNKIRNPIVFQAYDGDLVYGTLALVVANITTISFQDIKFERSNCIDINNNNQGNIVYQPNTCSRFKETYKSSFAFVWKIVDPVETFEGPSKWGYAQYYNRQNVIFQSSNIKGRKIDQIPAILELLVDKVCRIGVIKTSVLLRDTGYAGIAFLYQNSNNYYSLELHFSEELRFCRLRKTSKGTPNLITENTIECSQIIEKDQWISLIIELTDERLLVYLGQNIILQKVFDLKREDGQESGKVALLSYGGPFGFDNFEMMPNEDYRKNDQKNEITINSKLPYGECLKQTVEEREKYCKRKFELNFDKQKMSHCNGKFCSSCCELEVFASHKRRECEHQCQSVFLMESSEKVWRKCVEEDIEETKIYGECEQGGKSHTEASNCKKDLCNLCCLRGKQVLELGNSEKCQAACSLKYLNI